MASTSYAAFVYARCVSTSCVIDTSRQGVRFQRFRLSKGEEWRGYEVLIAKELNVVRGVAEISWCQRHLPLPCVAELKLDEVAL